MNSTSAPRATTRIYEVNSKDAAGKTTTYLIDAASSMQAERHVARKTIGEAKIASAKRIAELMGDPTKVKVETAGAA